MKRHPFGPDVKVVPFKHADSGLRSSAQSYIEDFITPIFTNSFSSYRLSKPYAHKPLYATTILDHQLSLIKIGPKPKPILGLKSHTISEMVIPSDIKSLRYRLELKLSYGNLLKPSRIVDSTVKIRFFKNKFIKKYVQNDVISYVKY